MELDKSILLQKQVKDNSEDLQCEFLDMKNWEKQMKRKEQELLSERSEQILPPVRSKHKKKAVIKESKTVEGSKRIKSCDYSAWDKFDVNAACQELDKGHSDDSSEDPMSKEELEKAHSEATEHKQQGNIFVQQQKWDKAIASYSEAIKIFPYDAIFYANRALCHIKQDNLYSAEADCSSAIQLDEIYVKAYHRRATVRMSLKQYEEAKQDIEKILSLESSNKEAKALLTQVEKQLKKSRPVIIPKEDTAEDIPIEKKIAEKMLSDIKLNKKEIDTKEEKDSGNGANLKPTAKPTSISATESKRDPRIPDWLPEKDNVEIVEPIKKPPHLRSKEPLKRIYVQEADLSKPFKKEIEASSGTNQKLPEISANTTKSDEKKEESKSQQTFTASEIPPIPKTAVQFLLNWKKYNSSDFRYRYLKQLPPGSLPKIFQDSMESDVFADILATLKTEFIKRQEPIFSYLKDLSDVKRFRAFIMFITKPEKQDLQVMFSYCKMSEKISDEEHTDLRKKYEV